MLATQRSASRIRSRSHSRSSLCLREWRSTTDEPTTFTILRPGDEVIISPQPMQRLDGFREETWTRKQWADYIRMMTHVEVARRGTKSVALASYVVQWEGLAIGFATLTEEAGPSLISITRRVRQVIESIPDVRRFQMTVRADFEQGNRWARMLGCESEGILRSYGKNGEDHVMYARLFER